MSQDQSDSKSPYESLSPYMFPYDPRYQYPTDQSPTDQSPYPSQYQSPTQPYDTTKKSNEEEEMDPKKLRSALFWQNVARGFCFTGLGIGEIGAALGFTGLYMGTALGILSSALFVVAAVGSIKFYMDSEKSKTKLSIAEQKEKSEEIVGNKLIDGSTSSEQPLIREIFPVKGKSVEIEDGYGSSDSSDSIF